jgi:hypothetical protein
METSPISYTEKEHDFNALRAMARLSVGPNVSISNPLYVFRSNSVEVLQFRLDASNISLCVENIQLPKPSAWKRKIPS